MTWPGKMSGRPRVPQLAQLAQLAQRVRQCEAIGEFAMAEHIREIMMDEQEHQIDLATALGTDVPNMSG
jgi:hypothetical protein